jgi:hypothetical protein
MKLLLHNFHINNGTILADRRVAAPTQWAYSSAKTLRFPATTVTLTPQVMLSLLLGYMPLWSRPQAIAARSRSTSSTSRLYFVPVYCNVTEIFNQTPMSCPLSKRPFHILSLLSLSPHCLFIPSFRFSYDDISHSFSCTYYTRCPCI